MCDLLQTTCTLLQKTFLLLINLPVFTNHNWTIFFTVDEIKLAETLSLIEGKHSVNAILPSKSDIKDGLLKMILYCNLSDTKVNGKK